MIRYKQILTYKLIGGERREPIGKILDVVYSNDYRRITHLIIKNNNLIKNKITIPFEDIIFKRGSNTLFKR